MTTKASTTKPLSTLRRIWASVFRPHPSTATSYNNIGLYKNKRDYNKAIEYFETSLEIYLATLGADHPDTAKCYSSVQIAQNDMVKARHSMQRAVDIFSAALGPSHPRTNNARRGLLTCSG